MSEFLPSHQELLPLMPGLETQVQSLMKESSERPPEEVFAPYSKIAGVDLNRLREADYEGKATSKPPDAEDLKGYFFKIKGVKRRYYVQLVKNFYQVEGEPTIEESLRAYALEDGSQHEKFRDMVIVEEEINPGITKMMIFDYPTPPPWTIKLPLKEGGFKEVPYLRLRDVLFINKDSKTAFSNYSSLQHQERGYAYGCLDMGYVKEEDLVKIDPKIRSGSCLKHSKFLLEIDSGQTNLEESLSGLAEVSSNLASSPDPQERLTANVLGKLHVITESLSKEKKLKPFLAWMDRSVKKLSRILPKGIRKLLNNMWEGISSFIRVENKIGFAGTV